jgi:hypothetical protein
MRSTADAQYIGILEAVVAVLAVKLGMHPEVTMANAIREISAQAGLETIDTDALIQSRWSGRNITQIMHVAQRVSTTPVHDTRGNFDPNAAVPPDDLEGHLSMDERLKKYNERRAKTQNTESDTVADTGSDTESNTVSPTV